MRERSHRLRTALLTLLSTLLGTLLIAGSISTTYAETTLEDGEYVIFYHHDLLGSPTLVTDQHGNTLWHEHSDPYGRARDRVSETGEEFLHDRTGMRKGYTGHLQDEGTDLVYMKARYYDPQIGRSYSNDPVGFMTSNPMMFNRYAYANSNPYKYTDPEGMNGVDAIESFFQEVSDGIGGFFSNTLGIGWGDGQADWGNVGGALQDGYDGDIDDKISAAKDYLLTIGGGLIGAVARLAKALKATTALERAKQMHSMLDPIAQRSRTTAGTETMKGVRVISSSQRRLNPKQRTQLGKKEIEGRGDGHAEMTSVNAAREAGLTPSGTAASRPICSVCASFLKSQGVSPLSPLK